MNVKALGREAHRSARKISLFHSEIKFPLAWVAVPPYFIPFPAFKSTCQRIRWLAYRKGVLQRTGVIVHFVNDFSLLHVAGKDQFGLSASGRYPSLDTAIQISESTMPFMQGIRGCCTYPGGEMWIFGKFLRIKNLKYKKHCEYHQQQDQGLHRRWIVLHFLRG